MSLLWMRSRGVVALAVFGVGVLGTPSLGADSALGGHPPLGTRSALAFGSKPASQVLPRVEYHLRQIDEISQHFEGVLREPCPRFATADAWDSYLDGEVDRVVLLVAHVEQAWVEAKETGDDDVRRVAKAPRKRLDEARTLLDKLQRCAGDNGATFSPMGVWQKIERDVPRRQAEIRQPES